MASRDSIHQSEEMMMPTDGDYERDQGDTIDGFDTNCDDPMKNRQVTDSE